METTDGQHFGHYLRQQREARGWHQSDVAERLNCTQQAVQKWESSDQPPWRSPFLRRLIELLAIPDSRVVQDPLPAVHIGLGVGGVVIETPVKSLKDIPNPKIGVTRNRIDSATIEALRDALPDALRDNVQRPIKIGGQPYLFTYRSMKVVVLVTPSPVNLRSLGWNLALAKKALNDGQGMLSHHYVLAVLGTPPDMPQPFGVLQREFQMMEIGLCWVSSVDELAEMIKEKESSSTEMEVFARDHINEIPDFFDGT